MRFWSQLSGVSISVKNSLPWTRQRILFSFFFEGGGQRRGEERVAGLRRAKKSEKAGSSQGRPLRFHRGGHPEQQDTYRPEGSHLYFYIVSPLFISLWDFHGSLWISACVVLQVVRGSVKVTEGSVHRGTGGKEAAEILGGVLWISTGHGFGGLLRRGPVWLQGCANISVALTHRGKIHPHTVKGRESSSLVVTVVTVMAHEHSRV